MSEGTARFTFTAACGLSMFAAGAAIVLRVKDLQAAAAFFLLVGILACAVALVSYRRYKQLRGERWQHELRTGEDRLGQVLNHARMNLLVDQITGPLSAESVDPKTR